MSSDSKNIKLGIVISYLTLFISVVGNILVTRKILGYVGDYQYGLFTFVQSISTWLTVISNALGASFVRFATIEKKETGDEKQVKTLYNRMFLIIGSIAVAISTILLGVLYINKVNLFGYSKENSDILYILFLFSIIQIGVTIGFSVYTLYINYRKKFIFSRLLTLLVNLTLYMGNWLVAYFTRNIIFVSLYGSIQTILSVIVQIIYVRYVLKIKDFHGTKITDKTLFKRIFLFSGILIFGAIVSQISNQVDKTILGSMGMAKDVTLYQLGQSFSTYVIVLSSSVAAVYIPTINELVVHNKNEELNELFLKVSRFQMVVITMVVFGFLTCGLEFVILWVGKEREIVYYIGASWLLTLLCSETMNVSLEIQRARNKHLFRCISFFLLSTGNIGLSLLLIQLFGKENAIWACLLGSVITGVLSNWVALNIYNGIKMKLPMGKYFLFLAIHIGVGAAIFGISYALFLIPSLKNISSVLLQFILRGVIFVILYVICIYCIDGKFLKEVIFDRKRIKQANALITAEIEPEENKNEEKE